MKTPILFLIFNRPLETEKVFNAIRLAQPKFLYIASDGPRKQVDDDLKNCSLVKEVVSKVDWDCEVKTLYREENLGCKIAVSSAIDWFFENVEEGIILEDDCLPDQSFFGYCEEMLARYRDEPSVMHIGGSNYQMGNVRGPHSYYFSTLAHVWGWATWRRAWDLYDVDLKKLDEFLASGKINNFLKIESDISHRTSNWKKVRDGEIDTWDYQWAFACVYHSAYAAIPNVNLIQNIGFNERATHTINESSLSNLPLKPISKIHHCPVVIPNDDADAFTWYKVYNRKESFLVRGWNAIKRKLHL